MAAAAMLLLAGLSCASATEPRAAATVLVTNATCTARHCVPLEVFALPSGGANAPGGPWRLPLGILTTPQACFALPRSATLRVVGDDAKGVPDTTTYVWTAAQSLTLGAEPPAVLPPPWESRRTSAFLPTASPGWRITFPTDSVVEPSFACTP